MMKKKFMLLWLMLLVLSLLTGCLGKDKAEQPVKGELYATEIFQALCPEGWGVLHRAAKDGTKNQRSFSLIKGGVTKEGLFEKPQKNTVKPYITLHCHEKLTPQQEIDAFRQDKERVQEVEDVQPLKLGRLTWHGFMGEAVSPMHGRYMHHGKHAYLWAEDGKVQYSAVVKFKYDGQSEKISLKDRDVQAILASVGAPQGTQDAAKTTQKNAAQ